MEDRHRQGLLHGTIRQSGFLAQSWRTHMSRQEGKQHTTNNLAALGRFVTAFESLVDQVRTLCINRICEGNPTSEQHRLIEISFHHQVMTAKPLFDILRGIIAEIVNNPTSPHYAQRATFKKVLGCIEAEYNFLCNRRNLLLHGTWSVGSPPFGDPNLFVVKKRKITADGLTFAPLRGIASELPELTDRCSDTSTWLVQIAICLDAKIPIDHFFKQSRGQPWMLFHVAESAGTTLPRTAINSSR